jgi:hypothetical protein
MFLGNGLRSPATELGTDQEEPRLDYLEGFFFFFKLNIYIYIYAALGLKLNLVLIKIKFNPSFLF